MTDGGSGDNFATDAFVGGNAPMASACIFCRSMLEGVPDAEHIVPESMGGWLTVRDVCNPCNHRFGGQVDSIVNDRLLAVLRKEAGLPVNLAHSLTPLDDEMRRFGPWVPDTDGYVRWSRDVYDDGNEVTIIADTIEATRRKLEEQNIRRPKQGRPLIHPQMEELWQPPPSIFRSEPSERELRRFHEILPRLVAKIAIEYIAMIAGPEVALSRSLDDIRSYAAKGSPHVVVGGEHIGSAVYWLPRTRRFQAVAGDADEAASVKKMLAPFENRDSEDWEPPADFPQLTNTNPV